MEPGWLVAFALILLDLVLVLVLNPIITKWRIKQLWNDEVELTGLDGKIIEIPYQTKDKDGNDAVAYKVGPLWATIGYAVSQLVANHVKMSLLSAKGKVSRELNTLATLGEASELGDTAMAVIAGLPRKWQGPALILAKLMSKQQSGQSKGGSGGAYNPGLK